MLRIPSRPRQQEVQAVSFHSAFPLRPSEREEVRVVELGRGPTPPTHPAPAKPALDMTIASGSLRPAAPVCSGGGAAPLGARAPTAAPPADHDWSFAQGDVMLPDLVAWGQLGSGRHFESWLAWSTLRWVPVVVKLPRPSRLDDEVTIDELAREAAVGTALQHPGVQRFLDVHLDHDPPFLVLEYVEGPTLSTLVDGNGALPARDVVLFANVVHLHEIGVAQAGCGLSLIHICRCRRYAVCRSRWSPYH